MRQACELGDKRHIDEFVAENTCWVGHRFFSVSGKGEGVGLGKRRLLQTMGFRRNF